MVEHNLAKVGVAGSSLVSRSFFLVTVHSCSLKKDKNAVLSVLGCPGGGIGRHAGLKILWPAMAVWVQVPPRVRFFSIFNFSCLLFILSAQRYALPEIINPVFTC